MKTVNKRAIISKLLNTMAPSFEIGDTNFSSLIDLAFIVNKIKELKIKKAHIINIKTPLVGSVAKACTDVMIPDLTKNVPIKLKLKLKKAKRTVHFFSVFLFSKTNVECNNAVAQSHGISEAFSTGSQNQNPPQPSS